jgi:IS4 transposase
LASLYKERWKIELDFRAIKTHMGMEMLRCKTPEMVKKEIAVHLIGPVGAKLQFDDI